MTASVTLPPTPTGAGRTFVSSAAPEPVDPTAGTPVVDAPTFRPRTSTTTRRTMDPSLRPSGGTRDNMDHGGFDGSPFHVTDLETRIQGFALGQSIVVGALLLTVMVMAVFFFRVSFLGVFVV